MTTLADFLLARIAEDEQWAKRAGSTEWFNRSIERHVESTQTIFRVGEHIAEVGYLYGPHIARHDPARVLAECDAKRRIVARLTEFAQTEDGDSYGDHTLALSESLSLLALPYADHPDFQDEWRNAQ